jgi:hypothetical protein
VAGEDLADQFASLAGFHEHAFWTFLERPKYWQGALAFHHADQPFAANPQPSCRDFNVHASQLAARETAQRLVQRLCHDPHSKFGD